MKSLKLIGYRVMYLILSVLALFWVWPALLFRGYARSVVYNGIWQLDKKKWLGRFWQRNPLWFEGRKYVPPGIILGVTHHGVTLQGFTKFRKISKLEFWFVVLVLWWPLDDCANFDMTDAGLVNSIKVGRDGWMNWDKRTRVHEPLFTVFTLLPFLALPWAPFVFCLITFMLLLVFPYRYVLPEMKEGDMVFGNAFDLGDNRAQNSLCKARYTWWQKMFAVAVWTARNPGQNWKYMWVKKYQ